MTASPDPRILRHMDTSMDTPATPSLPAAPDTRRVPDRPSTPERPRCAKNARTKPGVLLALVGVAMISSSFLWTGPTGAGSSPSGLPGFAGGPLVGEPMFGSRGADEMHAASGGELLHALAGDDELYGGPGDDVMIGGAGDDFIEAAGGGRDHVSCGPGEDLVNADAEDVIAANCETVYAPT